jgi:hypothetical protein
VNPGDGSRGLIDLFASRPRTPAGCFAPAASRPRRTRVCGLQISFRDTVKQKYNAKNDSFYNLPSRLAHGGGSFSINGPIWTWRVRRAGARRLVTFRRRLTERQKPRPGMEAKACSLSKTLKQVKVRFAPLRWLKSSEAQCRVR